MTKKIFGRRFLICATACSIGLFSALTAQAQTTVTGRINSTISLTNSCVINGTIPSAGVVFGTLNFGTHPTLFTTPVTAQVQGATTGAFTMQCQASAPPSLKIVAGAHDAAASAGGTYLHAMAHTVTPTNIVLYDVYSDAGTSSRVANNGTFFTSSNNGTTENVILYGKADRNGATVIPGTYNDTLTVQVDF